MKNLSSSEINCDIEKHAEDLDPQHKYCGVQDFTNSKQKYPHVPVLCCQVKFFKMPLLVRDREKMYRYHLPDGKEVDHNQSVLGQLTNK